MHRAWDWNNKVRHNFTRSTGWMDGSNDSQRPFMFAEASALTHPFNSQEMLLKNNLSMGNNKTWKSISCRRFRRTHSGDLHTDVENREARTQFGFSVQADSRIDFHWNLRLIGVETKPEREWSAAHFNSFLNNTIKFPHFCQRKTAGRASFSVFLFSISLDSDTYEADDD